MFFRKPFGPSILSLPWTVHMWVFLIACYTSSSRLFGRPSAFQYSVIFQPSQEPLSVNLNQFLNKASVGKEIQGFSKDELLGDNSKMVKIH